MLTADGREHSGSDLERQCCTGMFISSTRAAELQRARMLERIKADELRAVAMQHGAGRDHLGIDERAARHEAMEEPAVPVGPLHHGGDGESVWLIWLHFIGALAGRQVGMWVG